METIAWDAHASSISSSMLKGVTMTKLVLMSSPLEETVR
jgi:hypothetical protein